MSTTISIEERRDFYSVAMKYIVRNLGINIRPSHHYYDSINKKHVIFLNAILSNEILPYNKSEKEFVYIFKNIGSIVFDENLRNPTSILADKLEKKIYLKFWRIHKKLEVTIKEYGVNVWGRIGRIKTFLNPLYSIAHQIIEDQELDINKLKENDMWKYIKPFIDNELIDIDPHNKDKLICGNHLKKLEENNDQLEAVEKAIGIIIARSTNYLIKELRNNSFITYIDVPKVYYLDALAYGEMINLTVDELMHKYHLFGKRNYSFKSDMNLNLIISELVKAGLLIKNKSNNTITGIQPLYDKIFDFRSEILETANNLKEVFV